MRLFYCLLSFSVVAQAFIDPSLSSCPVSCQNVTNGWTHYHDIQDLQACEQPIIFDFNLYNTINDSASQVIFRACSSSSSTTKQALQKRQQLSFDTEPKGAAGSLATQPESRHLDRLLWAVDTTAHTSGNLSSITNALLDYLQLEDQYPTGEPTILFARSGSTIIGAYAGAQIAKNSFSDIIREFGQAFEGESNDVAVQSCQENSTSTNLIGLFATTTGDLTKVQEAVRGWNDAKCITSASSKSAWKDFSVVIIPGVSISISPDNKDGQIHARSTCKYTQVQSGDGCWALAQRCAISQDDLKKYNRAGICTSPNPIVGEYVCCSTGTVPDFSPKPNPDGSCKTYSIKQNDLCSNIASANSITVDMINDRNKMTWGWTGCSSLVVGASICVSTGSPPMPAAVQNAVCGPQVPGTKKPSDMSHIEKLNPCPLNACCNIWGQCGITKDFCVQSASSTGAPGTAKPGSNGCISSCGTNITNNADKVASFMRVGYFEAWNADRKCLHMRPYQIDTSHYTHVHFAFGNITHDYTVDISGLKDMFNEFKTLTNVKKILSFGGWSFSTDFDTAPIFRKGVTSAQRQLFATNVAKFIVDNGLDGVDFDWEYPGAPDIPGLPPGDPQDGANYVEFLGLLRTALPTKYSVSLAAPASFWYLRGFPLDKMHPYLDYIIYMTYDLHGQWDYGHQWASPGCPAGNCLRSHVNQTEVNDALVMITKAGVPAKKVIVGMPMYGRSFKMIKAGCWGPDCTYVGADSAAAPGRCTDTRGYISNFEIREIIKKGGVEQHHSDDGDILIYNSLEWVSWMNTDSYQKRLDWVKGLNFGGTSDWAIDLDQNYAVNDGPGKGDDGTIGKGDSGSAGNVIISPDIFSQKGDAQVSCQPPCNFVFPPWILDQPTTISPPKATVTYFENWSTTITVSGAAITTTASSVTTTVISIPPITTKTISVWNHSWNGTNATIWLTASVPIPPLTLTRTSTSSSDFVRPVVTWTYSPGPYPSLQTTNPGQPDPTPPGPPPPPPPGFAPTVKVTHAAPGPTCKPGQPCGKPCLLNCNPRDTGCSGICGCIGPLCPGKSCIGSGCLAASGQPSGCDSVTTVSDCLVECSVVKRPTTTYTRCNDPECTRTAAGCDTAGTTKTTTTTNMCAALPSITAFTTVAEIGEGGAGGWVIETGDFGTMPDDGPTTSRTGVQTCPPPQVTVPPLPIITNLGDDKSCEKCSSGQNVRKFQRTDAERAFSSLCDGTRTFSTVDGIETSMPVSKDVTIYIDVNRMTGPNCKDAKPFVMGDYCTKALEAVFTCDDDDTGSYGAAFVHNGDYGCVLWAAYARIAS